MLYRYSIQYPFLFSLISKEKQALFKGKSKIKRRNFFLLALSLVCDTRKNFEIDMETIANYHKHVISNMSEVDVFISRCHTILRTTLKRKGIYTTRNKESRYKPV